MRTLTFTSFTLSVTLTMSAAALADDKAKIADAISAAPPTLQDQVTVMDWDHRILREGDSQYTCMPTPPNLPGVAPMCFDKPWMKWAKAWSSKQPVEITEMGISYMLAGDGGASNTDPFANKETDDNDWIVEGPHLMIVTPDKALLDSLPTDPYYGGPYVMWKGTPYAHIMIPVGKRP